jgi:hypothetical protein
MSRVASLRISLSRLGMGSAKDGRGAADLFQPIRRAGGVCHKEAKIMLVDPSKYGRTIQIWISGGLREETRIGKLGIKFNLAFISMGYVQHKFSPKYSAENGKSANLFPRPSIQC